MRRAVLTCALSLLALTGASRAADYSKALWSYATGQVSTLPDAEERTGQALLKRMWRKPPNVPVEEMMFIYAPGVGTDCWAIAVMNPSGGLKSSDFVGTTRSHVIKTQQASTGQWMVQSQLDAGMFKGLYVLEGQVRVRDGRWVHMIVLVTSQMMREDVMRAAIR
ncbi:hypothetical protein [Deinococcus radiotolerans]|nr:hypothetical protein [Deinococcus radiotolerans]